MAKRKKSQSVDATSLSQLSKKELVEILIKQQQIIEKLSQEIESLKARLNINSKNSSVPPSADLLKKSEKKPQAQQKDEPAQKRKPGGQPGHKGRTRKGFGRVDRYETLHPKNCPVCGETLEQTQVVKVEKHQVAQLVERPIEIVEYQRNHCQCSQCGQTTSLPWPNSIMPGQDLGIKLQSFLGWLGSYGHLSYEKQQEMLWEVGKISIGVGTLVQTKQRIEQVSQPSLEALRNWVEQEQPPLHVDETPWAVKGVKEWLWVMAHPQFCLFHGGDTRSRVELESQLGSHYRGVLSSDDYSVYNGYPVAAQQKCLAHLRRHFLRLIEHPGKNNRTLGETWVALIDEAFRHYRLWQKNGDECEYYDWVTQFKEKLCSTLQAGFSQGGADGGKLLRSLRDKAAQWWYFLDHPHIPPDNNLAERALRLAVTQRKVSGGSRSFEGFRQTANLLSVVQTCRFQGRSVLDFFEQALMAKSGSLPEPPSLLPVFDT
ncbi:IS66 family transposase [Lusitaniella coriacea]|uniref:IS66 family transposase n=1 Tax=Lusitaniella coriacea TaxID=1983105 RepID=UPI003CFBBFAC